MQAHRAEATVSANRSLTLDRLPFVPGEKVEIIVLPLTSRPHPKDPEAWRKLEGLPLEYPDPFGPAAPLEDWEVLSDDPA